jgi:hypothetical protein
MYSNILLYKWYRCRLTVSFKELEGIFGWGQEAETYDSESESTSGKAAPTAATVQQRTAAFINDDDLYDSASEYFPSEDDQDSTNESSESGMAVAGKHVYTCSYTCFHIFYTYICF